MHWLSSPLLATKSRKSNMILFTEKSTTMLLQGQISTWFREWLTCLRGDSNMIMMPPKKSKACSKCVKMLSPWNNWSPEISLLWATQLEALLLRNGSTSTTMDSNNGPSSVKSLWDQLLKENTSKFRMMEHPLSTLRLQSSLSMESVTVSWDRAEWLSKLGISRRIFIRPRKECSLCQLFKVWTMHNLHKDLIPNGFGAKT